MFNRFEILKIIADISVDGFIKTISLKTKAFDAFCRGAVKEAFWSECFRKLSVTVQIGKKKYIVNIKKFPSDHFFSIGASCDCSDTAALYAMCLHITTAWLALKHWSLNENMLHSPYEKGEYQNHKNNLLYGNCIDNSFQLESLDPNSICIFPQYFVENPFEACISYLFIRDGSIMTPEQMEVVPDLCDFAKITYFGNYANIFISKIPTISQKYSLYIYHSKSFHKVKWDNNFIVEDITEIEIKNDTFDIHLRGKCYDFLLDNLYLLDKELIWDKPTGIIGKLQRESNENRMPWVTTYNWAFEEEEDIFTLISNEDFPLITQSFIAKKSFGERTCLFFGYSDEALLKKYIIKHNGHQLAIGTIQAEAKMVMHYDASQKMSSLEGKIVFGKTEFPLEQDFFDKLYNNIDTFIRNFVENIFDDEDKLFVIKSCFLASCAKNEDEINAIIETATKKIPKENSDFNTRKATYDFFKSVYAFTRKQFLLKSLIIKDDLPYLVSANYYYHWLFFALPHLIFDNQYKKNSNDITRKNFIETNTLYNSIEPLKKLLEHYSIALYINTKPVKLAKINITVDVTRPERDWFELHSDVQYDGQTIHPQEWAAIIKENGLWNRDDEVVLVDPQTHTVLSLLSRWMKKEVSDNKAKTIIATPRLRIFDLLELRKNGITIKVAAEDEKILNNLVQFTAIAKISVPKKLNCTLRDYQKEGYYWLAFLYQHRFGACLADDMGLGKTIQAIAFLAAIKEGILKSNNINQAMTRDNKQKPNLVVVPTSLVFNWVSEIKNFYPDLKVAEYTSISHAYAFDNADIFVTTYDIVRRDTHLLPQIEFNVIIFDEAQAVKNITTKRTSAARILKGDFKICITGTPLENHIGEYYSIMDLALPGLLPEYADFKSDISKNGTAALIQKTKPFILRRTKEIIAKELPEKIESDIYFYMTEKQRSLYTRITQEIQKEVTQAYKAKTKGQASIIALTALLRLRQICISPDLVIPAKKIESSPKLDYIAEQLPNLIQEGHAALIFSQFTKCLDLIEEELKKADIKYSRIDGTVSASKRKKIIEAFQKEKTIDILLMSLKTGGVGLNLTRASYIFHVDPWWNAAVENQASDRAYRIGQKNTVIVNRLLMHHSIEEKMLVLKKDKEKLFKEIIEGTGEKMGNGLSQADFNFLLE